MNPSELYSLTLSALTAARSTMLSKDWQNALPDDAEVRFEAAQSLSDVGSAIFGLSTAQLNDIAGEMKENAIALTGAATGLQKSLKNIKAFQTVLDDASALVTVIGKIVPLL